MNDNITAIKHLLETQGHTPPVNIEKFMLIIRGNIDLGISLLMLFKQQSCEYLDNLHYAFGISDKNPQKLFEAAHAIKGASLSIAAEKIIDLASDIENNTRDKKAINPEHYQQLIEATQELLNYITMIETRHTFLK